MTTNQGVIFSNAQKFWNNLRNFSFYNRTIFEIIFILIYALEQSALIILTYRIRNLELLGIIISIFAIIVLTTFSCHKLLMESRIKLLETKLHNVIKDMTLLEAYKDVILEKYNEIISKK